MLRYLPIAIVVGIFLDLSSLIWAGSHIGVLATLVLVFAGGAAGMALIRTTGIGLGEAMQHPGQQAGFLWLDARAVFLRMAAGLLFIVPGFVSDAMGLVLLILTARRWFAGSPAVPGQRRSRTGPHGQSKTGPVIEGEAIEIRGEVPGNGGDKQNFSKET